MMGDNVLASHDSRYFGFVPEDYVIGIATRVIGNGRFGKTLKKK